MRAPAPSLRPITGAPEIHQLVDLLGKHFTEGPAEHGEVLAEDEHLAAVNRAPTGDDTIGIGPVFESSSVCAMASKQVEFVEAARIEQRIDTFSRQHLALFVLALNCSL
jgi:hypothetical protein